MSYSKENSMNNRVLKIIKIVCIKFNWKNSWLKNRSMKIWEKKKKKIKWKFFKGLLVAMKKNLLSLVKSSL